MLPKINYSVIEIAFDTLRGRKVKFRPILVREEKILLMAKQSSNSNDIFAAVKQVVNNCCLDEKFDVDAIAMYELEYAFLVLRMYSIDNVIELAYHDDGDEQDYKFKINLEDVKINRPETDIKGGRIDLGDGNVLVLRYPPAALYSNERFLDASDPTRTLDELLVASIDRIFVGEEVYEISGESHEAVMEFIDSLDSKAYRKIQKFFESTPHMEHTISYTNKNGTERKIELRTLTDFFIL